ncbi:MAG: hypothetical protein QXU20_00095 [Candidatus Woesearchaeota archaeon]
MNKMKELELSAIKELIQIYEFFLMNGLNKNTSKKARAIYNKLTPGNTLLSESVNIAVGKLFALAYPNKDPNLKMLKNGEVKKIILNLKKRKQELENEQS